MLRVPSGTLLTSLLLSVGGTAFVGCWSFDYDSAPSSTGMVTATGSDGATTAIGATTSATGSGGAPSTSSVAAGPSSGVGQTSGIGGGGGMGAGPAAVEIAVGGDASCALDENGKVWCWGRSVYGELGDGVDTYDAHPNPQQVMLPGPADHLAMGETFGCAIVHGPPAKLYCWGRNDASQVGQSAGGARPVTAVTIGGASDGVLEVSLGASHGCARTATDLYCWGANGSLQTGVTGQPLVAPPQQVTTSATPVSVHAGYNFTCTFLDGESNPRCFGDNSAGQLGWAAGAGSAVLGLANNGASGTTFVNRGQASCRFSLGGDSYGCWGNNYDGLLGVDPSLTPYSQNVVTKTYPYVPGNLLDLFAGFANTCMRVDTGSGIRVYCFGLADDGLVDLTLSGSGTGSVYFQPVHVAALDTLTKMSLGDEHACGLDDTGTIRCWGSCPAGSCGPLWVGGDAGPFVVALPAN